MRGKGSIEKRNKSSEEVENEWLERVYKEDGFRSYVAFRDLQILKEIADCVDKLDFYGAVKANGRRNEILKLCAEAKKLQLSAE